MNDLAQRVKELYGILHQMPEPGFEEYRTSAHLADALKKAGFEVTTGLGGTGVVGVIHGAEPGPTVGLRADMDALVHDIEGTETAIHSCGHDSHCSMVLTCAEEIARTGIARGTLKILFQPAEEKLFGAQRMIEAGAIADVDILLGIHLRPIQEAKLGQATPALYHGASYIMETRVIGAPAHGARPHLGVNAIDAAAAIVNAVNAIHINPAISSSIKVTKLQAGGASLNAIPDRADMALDLRAQNNSLMEELIGKAKAAITAGAATVGASAEPVIKGGVPAAEYSAEMIDLAREAIETELGADGVLPPIVTPGGEDFHFYVKHKPSLKTAYIGLGVDLTPGLHHPAMKFNQEGLIHGVNILKYMVKKLLG